MKELNFLFQTVQIFGEVAKHVFLFFKVLWLEHMSFLFKFSIQKYLHLIAQDMNQM